MKALIFGATGQDGHYLTALLGLERVPVLGASRGHPEAKPKDLGQAQGSVADNAFVEKLIKDHKPTHVFHLAANSTTRHDTLFEHHDTIAGGTLNILESVRLHAPQARVFIAGSALQFENTGKPIDESTPFAATSPYAVARIESLYAARYFRSTFGIKAYVGYFFHHDSPLRSERHVNQKIVRAAQRIAAGSKERLQLGDIDAAKEFNFAGDVVSAVWTLMNQDQVSEAVIGCGKAHKVREWLEYCFRFLGLRWEDHVDLDSSAKSEFSVLVSNPVRIRSLGWNPTVDFRGLADLMLKEKSEHG